MAEPDWRPSQRLLHWLTAFLVIAAFAVAWPMVALPFRQLLLKFTLYQLHKTLGLLVALAACARLALRLRHGRPPWDAGLGPGAVALARLGHVLLYGLLVAVPLLGYATASSAPAQVPTLFLGIWPVPHVIGADPARFATLRPLHRGLAIALIVLAAGHGAMAVWHHRKGLPLLRRMWFGAAPPL